MSSKLAVLQTVWRWFRKPPRQAPPTRETLEDNPNFALPSWSFRSAELNRREIVPRKPCRPQPQQSEG